MSDKFEEEKIEMRNNFQVQIDNIAKKATNSKKILKIKFFN